MNCNWFIYLYSVLVEYDLFTFTVSWLILSEIFPASVRGRAISLATVLNWGTNLVVSLTFLDIIGMYLHTRIFVTSMFILYQLKKTQIFWILVICQRFWIFSSAENIGVSWTFVMFSVVCAVSVIFIFFAVPETRGKSLEQISKELNNRYGNISKTLFVFLKKYILISKKKLSLLL